MKKKLAFVLGGGGSRGAFQVGALKALLEAGILPDLLVGTSIGAVNAAFFAVHCLESRDITPMVEVWQDASRENLLPASHLWLTVRALFNKSQSQPVHRLKDFFAARGIDESLRFKDIRGVQLACVSCDLNHGCVSVYGGDPEQGVLEGVLASSALPPWAAFMEINGSLLMDGGALSNLPIEQALNLGASEIIALDLTDTRSPSVDALHFGPFLLKLVSSVHRRQADLEIALAQSRRVPVHHLLLQAEQPIQIWDFRETEKLVDIGYELTRQAVLSWRPQSHPSLSDRWKAWVSPRRQPVR
jgi:NTE family protein